MDLQRRDGLTEAKKLAVRCSGGLHIIVMQFDDVHDVLKQGCSDTELQQLKKLLIHAFRGEGPEMQ